MGAHIPSAGGADPNRCGPADFVVDGERTRCTCPKGLTSTKASASLDGDGVHFRCLASQCHGCPLGNDCRGVDGNPKGHRTVFVSDYHAYLRRAAAFNQSAEGQTLLSQRWRGEPTIAWLTRYQGCRRARPSRAGGSAVSAVLGGCAAVKRVDQSACHSGCAAAQAPPSGAAWCTHQVSERRGSVVTDGQALLQSCVSLGQTGQATRPVSKTSRQRHHRDTTRLILQHSPMRIAAWLNRENRSEKIGNRRFQSPMRIAAWLNCVPLDGFVEPYTPVVSSTTSICVCRWSRPRLNPCHAIEYNLLWSLCEAMRVIVVGDRAPPRMCTLARLLDLPLS